MGFISVFDIFKIGIGPSSSHTVGPMKAARDFALSLSGRTGNVASVQVSLHGSLAWTGRGHGTDTAIVLGLAGAEPDTVDPEAVAGIIGRVQETKRLDLAGIGPIGFDPATDIVFDYSRELPRHTNGMRFVARTDAGIELADENYYSLGGGFIAKGDVAVNADDSPDPPYPYDSAARLLELARANGLGIAELTLENELTWRTRADVEAGLDRIWAVMAACIARGLEGEGVLPGRMAVRRRAGKLRRRLEQRVEPSPTDAIEWVNAWAIAVNEENAAGGRVVTSPTNGAAGIIPAVLMYYQRYTKAPTPAGVRTFLLTAGAIGILYKLRASISGAEMGCQGEVGVACSMAAAGLAAAQGGDNDFVEEAAEIGMEHNLGLTCDPIGGLVQIPCIERNAMGAVKAINAATLASHGDGTHKVSLDQVIETMRQTGLDMKTSYKETSQGGLAVNVPEC
ncbi:MAG TPA: L-serine ammonia-lyase [Woeseiaceae bacterium]|nr:L-serine ammonia-lyase [Woeseiaceae bacterium]